MSNPICIFLIGGPGSGKDYVLNNIFSRFDLTEVQADQVLSGAASRLHEEKKNIVINGASTSEKIEVLKNMLEGYTFDCVYVSVTNKVSRIRNGLRESPLMEHKRIEKFLAAERLAENYDHFNFNNSINLNESSDFEKVFFASQIEKLLERVVSLGLQIKESPEPKAFTLIREKTFPPVRHHKSGLPSKYVKGLKPSEIAAKKAAIAHNAKLSDRDPAAYKDMPGDKRIREKGIPLSKYTKKYHAMYGEAVNAAQQAAIAINMKKKGIKPKNEEAEPPTQKPHLTVDQIAKKHNVDVAEIQKQLKMGQDIEHEHTKDMDVATDIALNHLGEFPDYYTRLTKLEKQAKAAMKEQALTPAQVIQKRDQESRQNERDSWKRHRYIHHVNKDHARLAKEEVELDEGAADTSLAAKAKKSGISLGTLRKVYNRGVAAWNSGHRPGTTPAQWGHARVNSYITKGKTYHTADKDLHEEEQIDEMQLVGTDEYRKHAIAMTPGQSQEIEDATKTLNPNHDEENCCPDPAIEDGKMGSGGAKDFRKLRKEAKETTVDVTPTTTTKRAPKSVSGPPNYRSDLAGLPVTSRQTFNALESVQPTLEEAVKYHLDNNISITENVFRPGSEMFFDLIGEAKRLYKEGTYTPADEYEKDLLESDIGEIAEYEGQLVVLDYPVEEGLEECWKGYTQKGMKKKGDKMVPNCVPVNEEGDPTDGHGIGKPFRQGGGGAVYVRSGDGVRKITFSNSGMAKKYNEPARVRSFVARHHCLTNKDKTSRSYWACRWPRFFSNSGQLWW